ncbi:MAG: DUF4350 domain-containing protein [Geobacteraceae bacterium]|nr:DUF4350 domain-containing protein [Geobacteraceae bacterium]NTW79713.1 DUF4350 domain-containing protein [Geobacteraceae bacterium]
MSRSVLFIFVTLLVSVFTLQNAEAQTVLIDYGHNERFKIEEKGPLHLSGLAEILQTAGAKIEVLAEPISDKSLERADSLVISGAFAPLEPAEVEAVVRFMQRGGKLAVMLHIAPPLKSLLDRLNVSYTNGVILEEESVIDSVNLNFRVNRLGSHPVLQGVNSFSLYGAWGLINQDKNARVIASTSPIAWIDLDRSKIKKKEATASFGVVIAGDLGNGGFLVFGDDAIFQNKFLDENNKKLAANLANWLK